MLKGICTAFLLCILCAAGPQGLPVVVAGVGGETYGDSASYDDSLRADKNKDGKVTSEEFAEQYDSNVTDEVFACLDTDWSGYLMKRESDFLKARFHKSKLSQLTTEELLHWLSVEECVPINMTEYISAFRSAELNGMSMWTFALENPADLQSELKIHSATVRRTLIRSICKEIGSIGCLGSSTSNVFFNSIGKGGMDQNADGQLNLQEFTLQGNSKLSKDDESAATKAFMCLDEDANGQISQEDVKHLRQRYRNSALSRLTTDEMVLWFSTPECIQTNMTQHIDAVLAEDVNGQSIWELGIGRTREFMDLLNITTQGKRMTVIEAICREILCEGCISIVHGRMHIAGTAGRMLKIPASSQPACQKNKEDNSETFSDTGSPILMFLLSTFPFLRYSRDIYNFIGEVFRFNKIMDWCMQQYHLLSGKHKPAPRGDQDGANRTGQRAHTKRRSRASSRQRADSWGLPWGGKFSPPGRGVASEGEQVLASGRGRQIRADSEGCSEGEQVLASGNGGRAQASAKRRASPRPRRGEGSVSLQPHTHTRTRKGTRLN